MRYDTARWATTEHGNWILKAIYRNRKPAMRRGAGLCACGGWGGHPIMGRSSLSSLPVLCGNPYSKAIGQRLGRDWVDSQFSLLICHPPIVVEHRWDVLSWKSVRRVRDEKAGFTHRAVTYHDALDVLHIDGSAEAHCLASRAPVPLLFLISLSSAFFCFFDQGFFLALGYYSWEQSLSPNEISSRPRN